MALSFPQQLKPGQCVLVPVDVKQNKNHPPSVHCAPIAAAQVLDDRALICRDTTSDGKARVTVRFASEVGGPFGAGVSENYRYWHDVPAGSFMAIFKPIGMLAAKLVDPDAFSPYSFIATEDGQLSLRTAQSQIYAVDNLECARRAVAGAFSCWGFGVEDEALMKFGEQFYTSPSMTLGGGLPTPDCIAAQMGEMIPKRIANAEVPRGSTIPLAADMTARPVGVPPLRFFANPNFTGGSEGVVLDVKLNEVMPFSINFAPINAKVVTNDWARLTYHFGTEICVNFQSEAGGPLGGIVTNNQEGASQYHLCIDGKNAVYAKKNGAFGSDNDGHRYKVDSIERAAFAIASVIGAHAYANDSFFAKRYADALYAARSQLTTAGEELPVQDQLANQTKTAYVPNDYHAAQSEMSMDMP